MKRPFSFHTKLLSVPVIGLPRFPVTDPEKEGEREIIIRTRSLDGKVYVEIEDNGEGMSEEVQRHLFDPFFTTKGAEMGTGLGMAIVESILHKHNARIELESEVNVGTKFIITFLPLKGSV